MFLYLNVNYLSPLSCWWMNLLDIDPQNRMHVCYLYLCSIPSPRLLAKSLSIKYNSDNPEPLWIKLTFMQARVLFGQLRVLYTAVTLQTSLPSLKKRFCPPVAKQWVFLVRLCSLKGHGIFSQRFTESVHPGHFTVKLCCFIFYRYSLCLSFCLWFNHSFFFTPGNEAWVKWTAA